tara:strand:- start:2867 stop:3061 length:195 start_codon:yes stop_codon:yes gene_type:complete
MQNSRATMMTPKNIGIAFAVLVVLVLLWFFVVKPNFFPEDVPQKKKKIGEVKVGSVSAQMDPKE